MLTMVTAQNVSSGTLYLPLMDSSDGYVVKDITGLDPVKATLVSTPLAHMDGSQLHHARREPRNIVMKLGLEPDYVTNSVASLRSNLFHFFMPKALVTLGFHIDGTIFAETVAVVESCDNTMFSSDPEVDISFICYDPDFYAPEPVIFESGTVSNTNTQTIDYEGTTDTGVIFNLTFPGVASGIALYNTRPDLAPNLFDIAGSFIADDILTVNTNPGSKLLTVTRAGLTTSKLTYMDEMSSWISLMHGENLFRAFYSGSSIPFTLEYTPKYGGL